MKTKHLIKTALFLIPIFLLTISISADDLKMTLEGHTDSVYNVVFHPDGDMIATKSHDSTIRIWNANTGQLLRIIRVNTFGGIAFSPDGNILASGGEKIVHLWNPETGQLVRKLKGPNMDNVGSVVFNPDGNVLASGSSGGKIHLWNSRTWELLRILDAKKNDDLAFNADGSYLASGGGDQKYVKVWNVETGQQVQTLNPPVEHLFDIAFSPEGQTLASAGWNSIDLWDTETGGIERSLPTPKGTVHFCVAFSPDGVMLANGMDSGGIDLWNIKRGIFLKNLSVHRESVYDVAFSPDGRTLASVGDDNLVHLWNITPPQQGEIPKFPEDLVGPNVKTWTEDFNDRQLDSWTKFEHQRERVTWQAKNGKLEAHTQTFCNGRLNLNNQLSKNTNYTLKFTAFPIETDQLRVKLKVLGTENADAGIFIGQKPDSLYHKVFQHSYLFANRTLGGPDGWGGSPVPDIGMNLTEIDVVFDRGHFYLYSEGEYIVDFPVKLQKIDYVGIAVFPKKCFGEANVTLDDFEISGTTIPKDREPINENGDIIEDKPIEIEGARVEDFSDENLDSWTEDKHQAEDKRVTWQAKDGLLDVWIQPYLNRALLQNYTLEFTGFPINAEKLDVRVSVLEAHNANVGIIIGQRNLDGFGIYRRTYKILHKSIWPPIVFGDVPDVKYENLRDIEINFNKGHFELLSQGEHILEFEEPNLPTINVLGIIAYTSEVPLAHFVMDNFIISDYVEHVEKGANVQAVGKAAVLWGELKQ